MNKWRIVLSGEEQKLLPPGAPAEGVLLIEESELIAKEVHRITTWLDPKGRSMPFYTNPKTQTDNVIGTAENVRTQIYGARQ